MALTALPSHAAFRQPSMLRFTRCRHRIPPPTPPSVVSKRPRFLVDSGACHLEFPTSGSLRDRGVSFLKQTTLIVSSSISEVSPSGGGDGVNDIFEGSKVETTSAETTFLSKMALALGIAAVVTLMSIYFKWPNPGPASKFPVSMNSSSSLVPSTSSVGFNFTILGHKFVLPEYTPGWIYFWLLMAAGCGLFISEEALNVWVGTSLARMLSLDGTWKSFVQSFSDNAPYVISTVLWVYWGVCISDMIPFYLGKFFRQTKASEDICSKLGIGREKAVSITRAVQKYGNLIGFVERFSIGVRNPTSFLAGAWGISSECFFAGVCCGGLMTVPFQLGIGFLLRERPMVALASVATAVGIWTVFPYLLAASTALFLFLRRGQSD